MKRKSDLTNLQLIYESINAHKSDIGSFLNDFMEPEEVGYVPKDGIELEHSRMEYVSKIFLFDGEGGDITVSGMTGQGQDIFTLTPEDFLQEIEVIIAEN